MKASKDSGRDSAPLMARRRGAVQEPQQRERREEQDSWEETPVLLRLPDLHPSEAVDAAVRRIEKQVRQNTSTRSDSRSARSETHASTHQRPPVAKSSSATASWNNRIIVTTFLVTILASGYMVIQRVIRDREVDSRTAPVSAKQNLEPIPSQRINRQSFQADSRAGDVDNHKRKQSNRRPASSTARIGSFSESQSQFPAMPVSYDSYEPSEVEQPNNEVRQQTLPENETYDLSIRAAETKSAESFEPRSIRMRDEHP